MKKRAILGLMGLTAVVGGCNTHVTRDFEINQAEILATDALMRGIIVQRRYGANPIDDPVGRPNLGAAGIFCAEPPPDAASAFASSFGATLAGDLSQVSPEVALSVSNSVAQTVGQLVRSNPVNIMRDGLYRACEAYANGAISGEEYRILLSGLDEAVVAMALANEISGFAPRGPTLEASGGAVATQAAGAAAISEESLALLREQLNDANESVEEQQQVVDDLRARETTAASDPDVGSTVSNQLNEARTDLASRMQRVEEIESSIVDAFDQFTAAFTRTAASQGNSPSDQNPAAKVAAEQIAEIHEQYSRGIALDYLILACVHEMSLERALEVQDEPPPARSQLLANCGALLNQDFLVSMAEIAYRHQGNQNGGRQGTVRTVFGPDEDVRALQQRLVAEGHLQANQVDGIWGPITAAALRTYLSEQ